MGGAGGKAEYLVNGLFANAPKLDHMKWLACLPPSDRGGLVWGRCLFQQRRFNPMSHQQHIHKFR